MIVANTFGSFAMLVVMGLGDYIISKGNILRATTYIDFKDPNFNEFNLFICTDSIPKWWVWGFWVSPLMYGQNAASVNEFLGHSWDKVIFYLPFVLIYKINPVLNSKETEICSFVSVV